MQRNRLYALVVIGLGNVLLLAGCNPDGSPFTLQPTTSPQSLKGSVDLPQEYTDEEIAKAKQEQEKGKDDDVAVVDPEAAKFLERLNNFENRDAKPEQTQPEPMQALSPQNINDNPSETVVVDATPHASNTAIDLSMIESQEQQQSVEPPVVVNVAVRASQEETLVEESVDAAQTNSAMTITSSQPDQSIDSLIATLQEKVETDPNDIESQWRMSMLLAAMGRYEEASQISDQIAGDAAQMISDTVQTVEGIRMAVLEPGISTDAALDRVNDLRTKLIRDAELQIPKVELCTKVSTFGVYDVMDPSVLMPYRANRAIVYCEVRNFLADETDAGTWRVDLSSHLEVMTSDGHSLWKYEQPDIVDNARQRREDFFLAQLVTLPSSLGPGEYVLKVSIEDKAAAKACEAVYPFTIGTPVMTASQ